MRYFVEGLVDIFCVRDAHHGEEYQRNDTAGENPRTPHDISPL